LKHSIIWFYNYCERQDKACEDVDGDNAVHTSSGSETDEDWEEQRRKQQALVLKDQGNQYLAAGQYTEAVECYTQGIESDGSNAVLYANRAMALLKQEK
jgi:tetratricopeptide (TPR) repeat protein